MNTPYPSPPMRPRAGGGAYEASSPWRPAMNRACVGLEDWFLSTDREKHEAAARICATCPALDWCRRETDAALTSSYGIGLYGTWAGRLYDAGRRITGRVSVGECPQCGALDGKPCRSPNGKIIGAPHRARIYGNPACAQCHQQFIRSHSRARYCSEECADAADRQRKRRYEATKRQLANNCIECSAPTRGVRCRRCSAIRASHISHGWAVA